VGPLLEGVGPEGNSKGLIDQGVLFFSETRDRVEVEFGWWVISYPFVCLRVLWATRRLIYSSFFV